MADARSLFEVIVAAIRQSHVESGCRYGSPNVHQDLLAQGKLIELFPDWPGERFPLYALHPSRHLPPAKVRAFIDFALQIVR